MPDLNPYAAPSAPVDDPPLLDLQDDVESGVPAGAWRRLAARMVDLAPLTLLVGVLTGIAMEAVERGSALRLREVNDTLLGLAILPAMLLIEGLVYASFGTTPGKWLFGLKVVDTASRPLRSPAYFGRLALLWLHLAGGIPGLSTLIMLVQGIRVARGKPSTYDVDRVQVIGQPVKVVRILLLLVTVAGVATMLVVVRRLG